MGNPKRTLARYAKEGKILISQLNELESFEFLIGNIDGYLDNLVILNEKHVQCFDHGHHTFEVALPEIGSLKYAPVGITIPSEPSHHFVKALSTISESQWSAQLTPLLSPIEIQGFLFRRRILLKDYELREKLSLLQD